MDVYLKTLAVIGNNTVKEDIAYPCIKLLDWLCKISKDGSVLSHKDVTNIGKAIVYLNTCYQMHGEELTKYLLENYSLYENCIKSYFCHMSKPFTPAVDILKNLARRNDGAELLCYLEIVTATICDLDYESLRLSGDDDFETSENRFILIDLLQSLLQVPYDQMNVAIERAINYMPFTIIGLVFNEPFDSFYGDTSIIVADKICQLISDISISKFFIRSLYQSICISKSGLQFFWLCLANMQFADSIQTFVLIVLSKIFEEQPNVFECPELFVYKEYEINHVLYLAWAALAPQSPCRDTLFNSIAETKISEHVLNLVNTFESIFER